MAQTHRAPCPTSRAPCPCVVSHTRAGPDARWTAHHSPQSLHRSGPPISWFASSSPTPRAPAPFFGLHTQVPVTLGICRKIPPCRQFPQHVTLGAAWGRLGVGAHAEMRGQEPSSGWVSSLRYGDGQELEAGWLSAVVDRPSGNLEGLGQSRARARPCASPGIWPWMAPCPHSSFSSVVL